MDTFLLLPRYLMVLLLNVSCNCLLKKSDYVYFSFNTFITNPFCNFMEKGPNNMFTVRKRSMPLANTKAISLDALSIAKLSQLLTNRCSLFFISIFFLTTFSSRNAKPGTNFCFTYISTSRFSWCLLKSFLVLFERVLSKAMHIGLPEGHAMNKNSFFCS